MSQLPRVAPVIAGWPDLIEELDRWQAAGRVATLWWRDDDTVAPSAALDRLLSLAGNVPVALAVIPAAVDLQLAHWLSRRAGSGRGSVVAVLQHGWRHANHSAGKKSEFSAERPRGDVEYDLTAGLIRLRELFETRVLPVLVPPWNRFDDSFLPLLRGCGLRAISRSNPRGTVEPVPGVIEVNVHVDLVAWAGGRGFVGEETALGGLVEHLRARRLGDLCTDEPTGILTHHLVHQVATDAFLRRLMELTEAHAAARWLDATEVFASTMLAPA